MTWLAHSAKPERDRPAQSYLDHVNGVLTAAKEAAADATWGLPNAKVFTEMVTLAAEFHDLGKLDDDNQRVLKLPMGKPLPHDHVDAGVKHLFSLHAYSAIYAAMLAYSHHRGLPDLPKQKARDSKAWRGNEDSRRFHFTDTIARTDANLTEYLRRHQEALPPEPLCLSDERFKPSTFDLRMALSCLADADHGDTARHYGAPLPEAPALQAAARLTILDAHVSDLSREERCSEREKERRKHGKPSMLPAGRRKPVLLFMPAIALWVAAKLQQSWRICYALRWIKGYVEFL